MCVELFLQDKNPLVFQDVTDLTGLVQKIPELSGPDRTNFDTGRITAFPNSLYAKSTLLDDTFSAGPIAEKVGIGIGLFFR